MDSIIIRKLVMLQKRFYELKKLIGNPKIINDHKRFCILSQEQSQLSEVVKNFEIWLNTKKEITHTKKMLSDSDIYDMVQDELKIFYHNQNNLEKKIKTLLLPKDPHDEYSCFIELRAGTGGKEAAIFTKELFRMYTRYAEIQKWNIEIINSTYADHGGYKEIIAKISYLGSYKKLKFESGGHRVQRIPHTESQGRIHTSTCTVAVIPEIPNVPEFNIDPNDLRIDTFRSSGSGGQHVNTTDSAIRITHIPSGVCVECQDERSQHKNKAKALSVLRSRLYAIDTQRRQKEKSDIRKNLIGTGDRSDRIRTYNFQQGRITDHRIAFTSYKLNEIMHGKLEILTNSILIKHNDELLNQWLKLK